MLKFWQKYFWWIWGGILAIALILALSFIGRPLWKFTRNYQDFLAKTDIQPASLASELIAGIQDGLTSPLDKEIVFLILGADSLDGDTSAQSDRDVLTDTIILANLDLTEQTINLLSLPRDIYLPEQNYKINEIYNRARLAGEAEPKLATAAYLSQLLDENIDYTLLFTFDQVRELIDAVGGVSVNVETAFVDEEYPVSYEEIYSHQTISNSPYETISFAAGEQLMDGATALKYMRSRHSLSDEGNDLARAARQQKVIDAFSSQVIGKLFNTQENYSLNWSTLAQLYKLYELGFAQDLSPRTLAKIITQAIRVHYNATQDLTEAQLQDSAQLNEYLIQVEKDYQEKIAAAGAQKSLADWQFSKENLSIQPDDPEGILREASVREQRQLYRGAWVWVVTDWTRFPEIIKEKLNLDQNSISENTSSDLF